MVSIFFYIHPYLGKWSILTHIFQMGWNHQLASVDLFFPASCGYSSHISRLSLPISLPVSMQVLFGSLRCFNVLESPGLGCLWIVAPWQWDSRSADFLESKDFWPQNKLMFKVYQVTCWASIQFRNSSNLRVSICCSNIWGFPKMVVPNNHGCSY